MSPNPIGRGVAFVLGVVFGVSAFGAVFDAVLDATFGVAFAAIFSIVDDEFRTAFFFFEMIVVNSPSPTLDAGDDETKER